MAPIKFEEDIKDKLEKRTVMPSEASWSKLSQRLDGEEKRNKRSSFWWFGIAASITALVFVSITYFNSQERETLSPKMVEEKVEEFINETDIINKEQPIEVVADETSKIEEENALIKEETPKINVSQKDIIKAVKSIETSVASVNKDKPEVNQNKTEPTNSVTEGISIDTEKLNNVLEAVADAKTKNQEISEQLIDSLLKNANREILKAKILKKKTNVVDANLLLQDVEEALGQSFRTKIYEALKDGTKKARTAIADRNN